MPSRPQNPPNKKKPAAKAKPKPPAKPSAKPPAKPPATPPPAPAPPPPAPPAKPLIGTLRYVLTPEAESSPVRQRIVDGMNAAIEMYNQNAPFDGEIAVHYDAGVGTAEASGNRITFGGMTGYRVSLHEIAHVMGIGLHGAWWSPQCRDCDNMVWTGPRGVATLWAFDGPNAVLHADTLHFWNYGLNWDEDLTPGADVRHVACVWAMVQDMKAVTPNS